MSDEKQQMTNPEQDREILAGIAEVRARTEALVERLLTAPVGSDEFRDIGFVSTDGITEAALEQAEPMPWPIPESFSVSVTLDEASARRLAALVPPEWSLGEVQSAHVCQTCGEELKVVADIRTVEKTPTVERWTCPVRNAEELRAHQVEHDADADVETPLTIVVEVKR